MDAYTEKLLQSGEDLLLQGWTPRGVALLERAMDQDPDDNQVMLRAATSLEKHGALAAAARAYRRLADVFEAIGRPEKAPPLRARADQIDALLRDLVHLDRRGDGDGVPATRVFRPPARSAGGFLAFCLGAAVAVLPFGSEAIGERLLQLEITASPSTADGLDGRTRAALGKLTVDER